MSALGTRIHYSPAAHGPLAAAVAAAPAGATIVLPAGEFEGPIFPRRDLEIQGAGPAATFITGRRAAPLVIVEHGPLELRLAGLGLREGEALYGGALRVAARAKVTVEDCLFLANRARRGGGAIYMTDGELHLRKSLLEKNAAILGGAIFCDGIASALLEDVTIEGNAADTGGGIYALEEAIVRLRSSFVRANEAREGGAALAARGSRSRAPALELARGGLAGKSPAVLLEAAPGAAARPTLEARDADLPAELRSLDGFRDAGGNRFAP
jgi:predicted outer membrane repeat protein